MRTYTPKNNKKNKGNGIYESNDEDPLAFVYVMKAECGDVTYYKIGFAKNPNSRLSGVQTGCPVKVELVWATNGCRAVEKKTHYILQKFKSNGEWFCCSLIEAQEAIGLAKGKDRIYKKHILKSEDCRERGIQLKSKEDERKENRKLRLAKFKSRNG